MSLPARVRVTRPLLPLAPAVAAQVQKRCPEVPLSAITALATAVAGGAIIGVQVRWQDEHGPQEAAHLDTNWRGRCIEEEMQKVLAGER